jgi:hypothetical protein
LDFEFNAVFDFTGIYAIGCCAAIDRLLRHTLVRSGILFDFLGPQSHGDAQHLFASWFNDRIEQPGFEFLNKVKTFTNELAAIVKNLGDIAQPLIPGYKLSHAFVSL